MRPRNYTKPSDLMKKWDLSNLLEYKNVMELKLNDLEFKKFYDFVSTDDGYRGLNGSELSQLELEIQRVKNLIVVVSDEISSRNS
jgi:hypothetical protein